MQILVDVLDDAGNKLGSGPLRALRWRHTAEMDRAGAFECEISASDPQASVATATRTLRAWGVVDGVRTALGTGIIDEREIQPQRDGEPTIRLSGDDQLRALTWRLVDDLELGGLSPIDHVTALYGIQAEAPGWTFVPAASPPYADLYLRFASETVLAAMRKFAQANGTHFYLSGDKTLTLFDSFTPSGVRAMTPPVGGVAGASVAWIGDLRQAEESYDIVTRVRPFATGTGRIQLGISATDRTVPAGFTLNTATGYLINNDAELIYGVRERRVDFPEIGPISNTDGDVQTAANALFDASLIYLQRHAAPVRTYDVELIECPVVLRPGHSLPVVYRRVVDGVVTVEIDETLLVLGATTSATPDGARTTDVTVATVDRWPSTDVDSVVEQVEQGRVYRAHPQYNANSYTTSYQKPVDETETATLRFRFGEEVAEISQVVFDFELQPLESTVKSVGASSATTSSGGGTTVSST
ncbi:MAG TPA: hypothetical protein PL105_01870, partial [Caldilineaceae bacterium]|nr:hypothetical protein [Caldilineaceae bacterium]